MERVKQICDHIESGQHDPAEKEKIFERDKIEKFLTRLQENCVENGNFTDFNSFGDMDEIRRELFDNYASQLPNSRSMMRDEQIMKRMKKDNITHGLHVPKKTNTYSTYKSGNVDVNLDFLFALTAVMSNGQKNVPWQTLHLLACNKFKSDGKHFESDEARKKIKEGLVKANYSSEFFIGFMCHVLERDIVVYTIKKHKSTLARYRDLSSVQYAPIFVVLCDNNWYPAFPKSKFACFTENKKKVTIIQGPLNLGDTYASNRLPKDDLKDLYNEIKNCEGQEVNKSLQKLRERLSQMPLRSEENQTPCNYLTEYIKTELSSFTPLESEGTVCSLSESVSKATTGNLVVDTEIRSLLDWHKSSYKKLKRVAVTPCSGFNFDEENIGRIAMLLFRTINVYIITDRGVRKDIFKPNLPFQNADINLLWYFGIFHVLLRKTKAADRVYSFTINVTTFTFDSKVRHGIDKKVEDEFRKPAPQTNASVPVNFFLTDNILNFVEVKKLLINEEDVIEILNSLNKEISKKKTDFAAITNLIRSRYEAIMGKGAIETLLWRISVLELQVYEANHATSLCPLAHDWLMGMGMHDTYIPQYMGRDMNSLFKSVSMALMGGISSHLQLRLLAIYKACKYCKFITSVSSNMATDLTVASQEFKNLVGINTKQIPDEEIQLYMPGDLSVYALSFLVARPIVEIRSVSSGNNEREPYGVGFDVQHSRFPSFGKAIFLACENRIYSLLLPHALVTNIIERDLTIRIRDDDDEIVTKMFSSPINPPGLPDKSVNDLKTITEIFNRKTSLEPWVAVRFTEDSKSHPAFTWPNREKNTRQYAGQTQHNVQSRNKKIPRTLAALHNYLQANIPKTTMTEPDSGTIIQMPLNINDYCVGLNYKVIYQTAKVSCTGVLLWDRPSITALKSTKANCPVQCHFQRYEDLNEITDLSVPGMTIDTLVNLIDEKICSMEKQDYKFKSVLLLNKIFYLDDLDKKYTDIQFTKTSKMVTLAEKLGIAKSGFYQLPIGSKLLVGCASNFMNVVITNHGGGAIKLFLVNKDDIEHRILTTQKMFQGCEDILRCEHLFDGRIDMSVAAMKRYAIDYTEVVLREYETTVIAAGSYITAISGGLVTIHVRLVLFDDITTVKKSTRKLAKCNCHGHEHCVDNLVKAAMFLKDPNLQNIEPSELNEIKSNIRLPGFNTDDQIQKSVIVESEPVTDEEQDEANEVANDMQPDAPLDTGTRVLATQSVGMPRLYPSLPSEYEPPPPYSDEYREDIGAKESEFLMSLGLVGINTVTNPLQPIHDANPLPVAGASSVPDQVGDNQLPGAADGSLPDQVGDNQLPGAAANSTTEAVGGIHSSPVATSNLPTYSAISASPTHNATESSSSSDEEDDDDAPSDKNVVQVNASVPKNEKQANRVQPEEIPSSSQTVFGTIAATVTRGMSKLKMGTKEKDYIQIPLTVTERATALNKKTRDGDDEYMPTASDEDDESDDASSDVPTHKMKKVKLADNRQANSSTEKSKTPSKGNALAKFVKNVKRHIPKRSKKHQDEDKEEDKPLPKRKRGKKLPFPAIEDLDSDDEGQYVLEGQRIPRTKREVGQKYTLFGHTYIILKDGILCMCDICIKKNRTGVKHEGSPWHGRRHILERYGSFECEFCGQHFGRSDNLKTHIKSKHGDPMDTYKCPYCSTVILHKKNITAHLNKYHAEIEEPMDFIVIKPAAKPAPDPPKESQSPPSQTEFTHGPLTQGMNASTEPAPGPSRLAKRASSPKPEPCHPRYSKKITKKINKNQQEEALEEISNDMGQQEEMEVDVLEQHAAEEIQDNVSIPGSQVQGSVYDIADIADVLNEEQTSRTSPAHSPPPAASVISVEPNSGIQPMMMRQLPQIQNQNANNILKPRDFFSK